MKKEPLVLAYSGGLDTSYSLKKLSQDGYEIHAVSVNTGGFSIQEIETYIPEFFGASDRSRPVLLEIHTPKTENDKVLKDFFEHFKQ